MSMLLAFLRGHVPTCLAWSSANVSTCLSCLGAHVPCMLTCSRTNVFCVVSCSLANVPQMVTFLKYTELRTKLLTCKRGLPAHVLTCQYALSSLPQTSCVTTWSPANMLCFLSDYFRCQFFHFHCHYRWSCTHCW